ncbi:MAG: peptidoglycan-binding protein [Coriobacteriia bacterium]|nr:peptidoglycan-binding protein [Coriobacteriia bacterium]
MRFVRPGSRGPAVEDIQRRLLSLGYDLGPTGVDGVFLGLTTKAVQAFQLEHQLSEDGIVGDETWSALVRAGLRFGDRTLYLRLPHFHGHDVLVLQQALNVLGFAAGATDSIFGAFTERAVREFQRNAGLPHDGIVGPETAGTINNLRHVWEGKDARPHSAARVAPARAAEVLARVPIAVAGDDDLGRRIAERIVNLAHATTEFARMHVLGDDELVSPDAVLLRMCGVGGEETRLGRPHVRADEPEALAARLLTAIATVQTGCREVVIELGPDASANELEEQRAAIQVLDATCAAFD